MMTPQTSNKLKAWLIGGPALGLSAALGGGYLKSLAKANESTELDDNDTLILRKKRKPAEEQLKKADAFGNALFVYPTAAATTIGTYLLAAKAHRKHRKRKAIEDVEKAQRQSLSALGYETVKEAGAGETLASLLLTTPVLAAVAGGGLTYNLLNNWYPKTKTPPKNPIKKVVVEEEKEKKASIKVSASTTDGYEFIAQQLYATKQASTTNDLIHAVCDGRADELEHVYKTTGDLDAVFDITKRASDAYPDRDPMAVQLAVSYLIKAASYSSGVQFMAAVDWYDKFPSTVHQAASFTKEAREHMCDAACFLGKLIRVETSRTMLKSAALIGAANVNAEEDEIIDMDDIEDDILLKAVRKLDKENTQGQPQRVHATSPDTVDFVSTYGDTIDELLNGK